MAFLRIQNLRTKVEQVNKIENDVESLRKINNLYQDLDSARNKLVSSIKSYNFYVDNGLIDRGNLNDIQIAGLIKKVQHMRQSFSDNPKSETLTSQNTFSSILKVSEEISEKIEKQLDTAHQDFFRNCYRGETSEQLQNIYLQTPENKSNLQNFREIEGRLNNEKNKRFTSKEQINTLKSIGNSLAEVRKKFKGDQPPDVKEFMKSIQEKGYASLSMLTPEVLEWINENNYENHYTINPNRNENI